jgi:hypothetical protein
MILKLLKHKAPTMVVFLSISIIISAYMPMTSFAQARVNWLEICQNPLVDALIMDPCYTMTTPDGYTLTPAGQKALGCIGGGTIAALAGVPVDQLVGLGTAVGCGFSSSSSSGGSSNNNILGNIIGGSLSSGSGNNDIIGNIVGVFFR